MNMFPSTIQGSSNLFSLTLPQFSQASTRPNYAQGPKDLASVKLLRISVTDRCNFRCTYCMPEEGTPFVPGDELLSSDEIISVAEAAYQAGIRHYKLTGGEPLLRTDLHDLIRQLRKLDQDDRRPIEISLTTNGYFLKDQAQSLRDAGLDRLTVSLDSMHVDRLIKIARGQTKRHIDQKTSENPVQVIMAGLKAAETAGFTRTKINMVVIGGVNDDEVSQFAALTYQHDWTIRFIEYMPLGESTLTVNDESMSQSESLPAATVDNEAIKASITSVHGPLRPYSRKMESGVGPAEVYQLEDAKGRLGFISAMSQPFCETCNRLRLTATGELRSCLFDGGEISLRPIFDQNLNHSLLRQRLLDAMKGCTQMKPKTHGKRGNRAMSQLGG